MAATAAAAAAFTTRSASTRLGSGGCGRALTRSPGGTSRSPGPSRTRGRSPGRPGRAASAASLPTETRSASASALRARGGGGGTGEVAAALQGQCTRARPAPGVRAPPSDPTRLTHGEDLPCGHGHGPVWGCRRLRSQRLSSPASAERFRPKRVSRGFYLVVTERTCSNVRRLSF